MDLSSMVLTSAVLISRRMPLTFSDHGPIDGCRSSRVCSALQNHGNARLTVRASCPYQTRGISFATNVGTVRIAQVSPLYESVPPQTYGGTERVVSFLTEELVRAGHDVTLFASGDSRTA